MAQHPIKRTSGSPQSGDGLAFSDHVDPSGNLWVTGIVSIAGTPNVVIVPGSPVTVTGVVITTPPANASTNITQLGGQPISEGQARMAASLPVALASDQTPLPVVAEGQRATYSASATGVAFTVAGDVFTITGGAGRTVRVTRVEISANATAAIDVDVQLIKRSSADSGGTPTAWTVVPHDSQSPTAIASGNSYTAAPTLGTAVGTLRADKLDVTTATTAAPPLVWDFATRSTQAVVLRGPSQQLAVNVGAIGVGASVDVSVEWVEDAS